MIFYPDNSTNRIRRNLAPGPPTDFLENFNATFDLVQDQEISTSATVAIESFYDQYIDDIESVTGQRLTNPTRKDFVETGFGELGVGSINRRKREKDFFNKVNELKQQNPELEVLDPVEVRNRIGIDRKEQREEVEDINERASAAGDAGMFLGTAGAIFTDPFVLASMLIPGAPLTQTLRFAGREALIAGATEIPIQTLVQNQRRQFGEDADYEQALKNVVFATGGGFAIGAGISGTARGVGRLTGRGAPEAEPGITPTEEPTLTITGRADEKINMLMRDADIKAQNPVREVPAEHEARVNRAGEHLADPEVELDFRPLTYEELLVRTKAQLTARAGNRMSRGERKAIETSLEELRQQANTVEAREISTILDELRAEVDPRTPARKVKQMARQRQEQEVVEERAIFDERINNLRRQVEQDLQAREAESQLSRIEAFEREGLQAEQIFKGVDQGVDPRSVQPTKIKSRPEISRTINQTTNPLRPPDSATDEAVIESLKHGTVSEVIKAGRALRRDQMNAARQRPDVAPPQQRQQPTIERTATLSDNESRVAATARSFARDTTDIDEADLLRRLEEEDLTFVSEDGTVMRAQQLLDDIRSDDRAISAISTCLGRGG